MAWDSCLSGLADPVVSGIARLRRFTNIVDSSTSVPQKNPQNHRLYHSPSLPNIRQEHSLPSLSSQDSCPPSPAAPPRPMTPPTSSYKSGRSRKTKTRMSYITPPLTPASSIKTTASVDSSVDAAEIEQEFPSDSESPSHSITVSFPLLLFSQSLCSLFQMFYCGQCVCKRRIGWHHVKHTHITIMPLSGR